jgi:prolipoprotein diacylglyceryltransferase
MQSVEYNPAQRIRIIDSSIESFAISWLGLIPVIGIIFAFWALNSCSVVRKELAGSWNPAGRYLNAAFFIACAGLVLWLGALAVCGSIAVHYYATNP